LKRGFVAAAFGRRHKTPLSAPSPLPPPRGERERGTNDSEIFMDLGVGGGVRAGSEPTRSIAKKPTLVKGEWWGFCGGRLCRPPQNPFFSPLLGLGGIGANLRATWIGSPSREPTKVARCRPSARRSAFTDLPGEASTKVDARRESAQEDRFPIGAS